MRCSMRSYRSRAVPYSSTRIRSRSGLSENFVLLDVKRRIGLDADRLVESRFEFRDVLALFFRHARDHLRVREDDDIFRRRDRFLLDFSEDLEDDGALALVVTAAVAVAARLGEIPHEIFVGALSRHLH